MLVDTRASSTQLIPSVLAMVPIEAGEVTTVSTATETVKAGVGLAKLRLLGRVLSSSVGGATTIEPLPAELEGLEVVVNAVTLGTGTKPLLGLNTLFTWGLSVDTVHGKLFINKGT